MADDKPDLGLDFDPFFDGGSPLVGDPTVQTGDPLHPDPISDDQPLPTDRPDPDDLGPFAGSGASSADPVVEEIPEDIRPREPSGEPNFNQPASGAVPTNPFQDQPLPTDRPDLDDPGPFAGFGASSADQPPPQEQFDVEVGPAVIDPDPGRPETVHPDPIADDQQLPTDRSDPDDVGPFAGLGAAGLLGHPEGTPIPASELPFVNQPQGEVPPGVDSVAEAAAGSGASSADPLPPPREYDVEVGPAVIDPDSDAPPPPGDFGIEVGPAVIDPTVSPPHQAPASEGPAAPEEDSTFPDSPSVDPSIPGLDPLPPLDEPDADLFGNDPPVADAPTYEEPSFDEPAAPDEPAYDTPAYEEATYDESTYEASDDEW